MKRLACILLTYCLFQQPGWAEVYKWVDEAGKTHFGDKLPEKAAAEDISKSVEKTNVDTSSKNITASFSKTEKTQDEIDYEKKKDDERQAAIIEPCNRLKHDIDAIASGRRVAFYDESGKEYNVPEKDRSKKLDEWKAVYKQLGCRQTD